MKYRFYVTNLFDGCIQGSNNEQAMKELSACEDFFIVDTESGQWLSYGEYHEIGEMKTSE